MPETLIISMFKTFLLTRNQTHFIKKIDRIEMPSHRKGVSYAG